MAKLFEGLISGKYEMGLTDGFCWPVNWEDILVKYLGHDHLPSVKKAYIRSRMVR